MLKKQLKYTSNCSGKVYAVIDGKTVASKTQSSKGNGSLTINGLEGATSYEVVVYIVSNDIYSEEYELNFTTLTPEEEEACEICGSAAHTTDECTKIDCELCGRVHEPEDKWCDSCSDHSHNEDEHCEVCGEYHETEPDKTCTVCENHEHNDEDHCGECGEVGGHTDECSENQTGAEE